MSNRGQICKIDAMFTFLWLIRERSLIMAERGLEGKLMGHETKSNNLDGL